jgi:hypothetical protein
VKIIFHLELDRNIVNIVTIMGGVTESDVQGIRVVESTPPDVVEPTVRGCC